MSEELILELLETYVEKGFAVNTDNFLFIQTKEIERKGYKHRIIPHNKKKFAEGNVYINNAENRFFKSWYGMFRGISKKYLSLWIGFFRIFA